MLVLLCLVIWQAKDTTRMNMKAGTDLDLRILLAHSPWLPIQHVALVGGLVSLGGCKLAVNLLNDGFLPARAIAVNGRVVTDDTGVAVACAGDGHVRALGDRISVLAWKR